jgi:hypothetical protein
MGENKKLYSKEKTKWNELQDKFILEYDLISAPAP